MIGAFGAQAVGHGGEAVGVPQVPESRLALEGGELVDDHLGLRLGHRLGDCVGIERVGHDRPGAEASEQVGLGRRLGHAAHVVARGGQLGTSSVPMAPVAPATNTFMGASFTIHHRQSPLETRHHCCL